MGSGWTVGQVAQAAGVTVRTLHHWESLGLLAPSGRSVAGYRIYSSADVARLQRVLGYRALGFALADIRELLDGDTDVAARLRRQSERLHDQAARLLAMAAVIERHEEARRMGIELEPHELLEVFGVPGGPDDPTRYAEEAQQRWGGTDAYQQAEQRTRGYRKTDWLEIKSEQAELLAALAAAYTAGVPAASGPAQELAERHRLVIDQRYYSCSYAAHRGLGELYVADERFTGYYDSAAPGLAGWLRQAIEANAAAHGA